MIKLPLGVDINNLIDDLRIFSWEAADILLNYSDLIKDQNRKNEIIKSKDHENPVTIAVLITYTLCYWKTNNSIIDLFRHW